MKKAITITAIFFVFIVKSSAQIGNIGNLLDSLISSNSYSIKLENNKLSGGGAKFLLSETRNSQFVFIGEEHNTLDIPAFTSALFLLLHSEHGFNYFTTEQDPVMMRKISHLPYRGNVDSVHALAKRYLNGFTFISDQELKMLATIGRMSSAKEPIWGCEQAFGVSHILDVILQLHPTLPVRQDILAILKEARDNEATRDLSKSHFISDGKIASRIGKLRIKNKDPHIEYLLQTIQISDSIYTLFKKSVLGDPQTRYYNNLIREQYMKALFKKNYDAAERTDHKTPKVLFKYGQQHLYKGLNPLNILSFGNYLSEFATSNTRESFSIYTALYQDSTNRNSIINNPGLRFLTPFLKASLAEWTLIDLRPLRPFFRSGSLNRYVSDDQVQGFKSLIFGFDSLLLFGKGTKASFMITGVNY